MNYFTKEAIEKMMLSGFNRKDFKVRSVNVVEEDGCSNTETYIDFKNMFDLTKDQINSMLEKGGSKHA